MAELGACWSFTIPRSVWNVSRDAWKRFWMGIRMRSTQMFHLESGARMPTAAGGTRYWRPLTIAREKADEVLGVGWGPPGIPGGDFQHPRTGGFALFKAFFAPGALTNYLTSTACSTEPDLIADQ